MVGGPDLMLRRDGGGMGPGRRCRRYRASASGELQRGVVAHAGLSFAGWNAVMSALLAGLAAYGATLRR